MNKKTLRKVLALLLLICFFLVLAGGYIYRKKNTWVLVQYGDASGNQGLFYSLKNQWDHTLILVDGGWPENEAYVRAVIEENGGTVDAWFITHYHADHVSAFNAIYQNPGKIRIRDVYDTPLDWDTFAAVSRSWDTPEAFRHFLQVTQGKKNIHYLSQGDTFAIGSIKAEVFHAYSPELTSCYGDDIPNNASLVFRLSGKRDSILFCGDAHQEPLAACLVQTYADRLQSEYVQTGHHGNNSLPESFYDTVKPDLAFFDAPQWLLEGEKYTAKDLSAFFQEKGVRVCDYTTVPNSFIFR